MSVEEGTPERFTAANTSDERADAFRLKGNLPRITRLSRKVLASASAVVLLVIGGAVIWALQSRSVHQSRPDELYSTEHREFADGLSTLPRDYGSMLKDVPVLGPPLPGDLGRPILAAQAPGAASIPDPDQQRREQEIEAARVSRLFASTNARETQQQAATAQPGDHASAMSAGDDVAVQNGQDHKLTFSNAPVDRRTASPDRITRPASPYVVQAGTIIPGALITGIRSDLPGQIMAQVTAAVYDSPSGRFLLVPPGARLIGTYDNQVATGQSRVLLVWTRLIMPNGRSIVLERQLGADLEGYAGLEDEVDNHWRQLIGAALLSTLLSVGSEAGAGTDGNTNNAAVLQALRQGFGNSVSQTGQQLVQQQMNIKPTLTIRPGFPVRVIVNRDLVLEPYRG